MQSRRTEPDRQEKKEKSGEWEWERRDEGKEGKRKLGLEKRKGPAGAEQAWWEAQARGGEPAHRRFVFKSSRCLRVT